MQEDAINENIKFKYQDSINSAQLNALTAQNNIAHACCTCRFVIVGFALDFSEIDLWWIINKRARLKNSDTMRGKITNRIIYHCSDVDVEKIGVLKSMDVEIHQNDRPDSDTPYLDYFKKLMTYLSRYI